MKFIFLGRGGLLTSIVLQGMCKQGFVPELVIIEHQAGSYYPNLTVLECERIGLKYYLVDNPDDESTQKIIRACGPDFVLVASLATILSRGMLDICDFYNVHLGVLPYYRGPFTNFWKIKNGDDIYGVTIHRMVEKIDNGEVMLIREKDFSDIINGFQFFRLNYMLAGSAVIEFLNSKNIGLPLPEMTPIIGAGGEGKYYRKFRDDDFELNLFDTCIKNYKFINRVQYYQPPFYIYKGKKHFVRSANLLYRNNNECLSEEYNIEIIKTDTVLVSNNTGIIELKQ